MHDAGGIMWLGRDGRGAPGGITPYVHFHNVSVYMYMYQCMCVCSDLKWLALVLQDKRVDVTIKSKRHETARSLAIRSVSCIHSSIYLVVHADTPPL